MLNPVLTPPTERELLEIWKASLRLEEDFTEWPDEKREMWNENLDDLFDTYNSDFDRMMKRTLNVGTIQVSFTFSSYSNKSNLVMYSIFDFSTKCNQIQKCN